MPVADLKYGENFFSEDSQPPVIPVIFNLHNRLGKNTKTFSFIGWEGWEVEKKGKQWSCSIPNEFTLKCLQDGYAEIPATKYNKKKLEKDLKPTVSKPTYDRGVRYNKPAKKLEFRDKKGNWKFITQQTLEDGEIRMINTGEENPPLIKRKLTELREFSVDKRDKGNRDVESIRPWLKQFISSSAVLESASI